MIALELSNTVKVRSGSGVYVLPKAKESPLRAVEDLPGPYEILEARALIEGEAAEKIDELFHIKIARGSRNSAMLSTVKWLWKMRNDSEIATVFHRHAREEGSTPSQEEHQNILDAITRRDPSAARDAMTSHLERVVLNFNDYTPE